ncbi:MAG: DUF4143 domain-containing protein [Peptococcia bacterium]
METAVYKHVAAFYQQRGARVGYYRGGKKGKEIDIVVDYPKTNKMLIEIKYREHAPILDNDAICDLCAEAGTAIVVTKRFDDYGIHHTPNGGKLLRIPAFAFLYLLGHAEKNEVNLLSKEASLFQLVNMLPTILVDDGVSYRMFEKIRCSTTRATKRE